MCSGCEKKLDVTNRFTTADKSLKSPENQLAIKYNPRAATVNLSTRQYCRAHTTQNQQTCADCQLMSTVMYNAIKYAGFVERKEAWKFQ